MADGPTVVNSGGGGGAVAAVVVAIIALVIVLFFTGVIDFGGGTRNVDVNVDLPKVDAPSAPTPAPANGD
jgi:hypothetical protein